MCKWANGILATQQRQTCDSRERSLKRKLLEFGEVLFLFVWSSCLKSILDIQKLVRWRNENIHTTWKKNQKKSIKSCHANANAIPLFATQPNEMKRKTILAQFFSYETKIGCRIYVGWQQIQIKQQQKCATILNGIYVILRGNKSNLNPFLWFWIKHRIFFVQKFLLVELDKK